MSRHIPDAIAGWFGYVPAHEKTAAYFEGTQHGASRAESRFSARLQAAVNEKAGTLEAERNGYRAQWEQAERRLKVANRRLQAAGKMPVTSFV